MGELSCHVVVLHLSPHPENGLLPPTGAIAFNRICSSISLPTNMEWNFITLSQTLGLFVLSGLAEVGGGWLVWQTIREHKPWWWALLGSIILVVYGFLPTLQPLSDFGRLYAIYGGVFVGLSFLWAAVFDGMKLDLGDGIGSSVCLLGVFI